MYILSICLPFLVCIISGRPMLGLISFILQVSIFGWPVAMLIAWISAKKHDKEMATSKALENFTRW